MDDTSHSPATVWQQATVTRQRRERQNGHRGLVIWFTGLSGSGKSTLAHALEESLHGRGCRTLVLDGDNMRHGLCRDLGFSVADRQENIRRIAEVAHLLTEAGMIALAAFIAPFQAERQWARERIGRERFIEVYCRCPLEICEQRDVKGLYQKARAGLIQEFTGLTSPYEEPLAADLLLDTGHQSVEESLAQLLAHVQPLLTGLPPAGTMMASFTSSKNSDAGLSTPVTGSHG
ncbi:MAG: adenylyl-sulfate kinase [Magnetococcus sp. MYC-9]